MQPGGAAVLMERLYGQLDMLASVDLSDPDAVDAACRVSKAVNDTGRTIMGVAELSVRAMGASPTLGNRRLLDGFFEGVAR